MRYYYVNAEGATTGPVTRETLTSLHAAGAVGQASPVIMEGASAWGTYAGLVSPANPLGVVPAPPAPSATGGLVGTAGLGLTRAHALWFFGVLLVAMVSLPIGSVDAKGREFPVTVLNSLRNGNTFNAVPLLALFAPVVGLVIALRGRAGAAGWRTAAGAAAAVAALLTYASLSTTDRIVRESTMGIAGAHTGLGLWVIVLGCLGFATLGLLPALRRLAASSTAPTPS